MVDIVQQKMMIPINSILTIIILVIAINQKAFACNCITLSGEKLPYEQSVNGTKVIFMGTVHAIDSNLMTEIDGIKFYDLIVTFTIYKRYKGLRWKTGKRIKIRTTTEDDNCSYPFEKGQQYFVFSNRTSYVNIAPKKRFLVTDKCTNTVDFSLKERKRLVQALKRRKNEK